MKSSMNNNARLFSLPLSLLSLAIAHSALAAEQEDQATLAPMVIKGDVLGSASDKAVRTYAGSRSLVDSEDLSKASVRGLDDALQRVPGIKVFDETGRSEEHTSELQSQ